MFATISTNTLAPHLRKGEGEMLAWASSSHLVKQHGKDLLRAVGKAFAAAGISRPHPLNNGHMWALKDAALPYLKWVVARRMSAWPRRSSPRCPSSSPNIGVRLRRLQRMALESRAQ